MSDFYEAEKTAVQEYLKELGADDERYLKSLANYQKLIVCEKLDSECGTKLIEVKAREAEAQAKILEAENRKIEAEAKMLEANNRAKETEARIMEAAARSKEADNRKLEAIGRVVSTVIETTGKIAITVGTSYLGFKSLILIIDFEKDGNLPPKLMNLAKGLIVRA